MRLAILGATGRIGGHVLNWALDAGHPVTALARSPEALRESGLDWTLVRATRLVNGPGTGQYRVSPDFTPRGGGKISRADVAHLIAAVLTENAWPRSAPALAY